MARAVVIVRPEASWRAVAGRGSRLGLLAAPDDRIRIVAQAVGRICPSLVGNRRVVQAAARIAAASAKRMFFIARPPASEPDRPTCQPLWTLNPEMTSSSCMFRYVQ